MVRKKVLEIVEAFGGGVFTMMTDLTNGLCDEFDVVIAYSERKQTPKNFENLFDKRIKFIKVENFTRNINFKRDIKALKELRKIIKEEQPDIIHLHSSKAGVLGRLAGSGKKYRMLYNPHGFSFLKKDDSKLKRTIYKLIEKIMAIINPKCTIVGCSKGEYEEAIKLNKNSVCINNGINVEEFENKVNTFKKYTPNFNELKICTVGRIGYQKNPKLFNEIANELPNNKFIWIGDGELRYELTAPNISVLGWKKRDEALQELNKYDIFLLTSLWEGLPMTLIEAGYLGKLCIVSNVIGNRDVIKNGKNGYIFENVNEIKKIIEKLEKENYIQITHNLKNDIIKNYNMKSVIEKYKEAYKII